MDVALGRHYQLESLATGRVFDDLDFYCSDPESPDPESPDAGVPCLLRSRYSTEQLGDTGPEAGIFRWASWLPVQRLLDGSSAPVTYHSRGLGEALELTNLFVTFSGFWPERGVTMTTGTFKECEAFAVAGRLPADNKRVLVVASAGNTARAFLHVAALHDIPLLVVVPESSLPALTMSVPKGTRTTVVAVAGGADYRDAIEVAARIAAEPGFIAEGGAKNVARRDGMGTTVLSAASTIGRIPEYYFQAIGSGTGAIAAWEANMRLAADGRFGTQTARLMLAQNRPFVPIVEAWRNRRRLIKNPPEWMARRRAKRLIAPVLSNRKPPYEVRGGLYDALHATGGECFAVTNEEARRAAALFRRTEGIDIDPAAAVAVAALIQAVSRNRVAADSLVQLNITGGGHESRSSELGLKPVEADVVIDRRVHDPVGLLKAGPLRNMV